MCLLCNVQASVLTWQNGVNRYWNDVWSEGELNTPTTVAIAQRLLAVTWRNQNIFGHTKTVLSTVLPSDFEEPCPQSPFLRCTSKSTRLASVAPVGKEKLRSLDPRGHEEGCPFSIAS